MPIEFLTDEQAGKYGQFVGVPSRAQLERFFFFNDADRALIEQRRRDHNRLGFGVQLGTVRFLGVFLSDPLDVPEEVLGYVAGQLKIDDRSIGTAYGERGKTAYEHAWEIRRAYGYREFVEAEADVRGFLVARAWTTSDGPQALFDRATAWLIDHKVLLPGVTVLARMVTAIRAEASERLWQQLTEHIDPELRCRLDALLNVEDGSRFSTLERLRTSPTRLSGPEMVKALQRVAEVRELGAGVLDVSGVPPNRLLVLARHGLAAKAPHLRQLTEPRRSATLTAAVRQLEQVAIDDALDLLDLLMATKLLARAERESIKDTLRRLPRFTAASAKLAAAIQILFAATETGNAVSIEEVWADIERVVPRSEIAAALAAVMELAPPTDEDADEVWRVELVKRYATVRPFVPLLTEVIRFGAVEGGQTVLKAVRGLGELLGRKKVKADEVVTSLVTGTWKRLVFGNPEVGRGLVDHRAYAFCVLEHLHRALRLRDVYAEGSDRWSDPRARLLDGEAWQRAMPEVITALSLSETPDPHLTELAGRLDAAYRDVATRLSDNAALQLTNEGARISLDQLEAVPEPPSLVALRATVARMLPKVDLPDLLLDVHGSTGCFDEFTHVSEASARMDDLPISIAAVLVAEACNVGFSPVVKSSVPALTRDRLSHVDQNYVRAETSVPANGRLIPAQARIDLASAWGGGLVASADGLRFVVPVATINAAPNPHYFGLRRGATWLNAVNDQYSGLGAIVIPGTLRDSMYILDLLLNLDGGQRPEMVVTDNASYSEIVFGLFLILGYQFAPRIADLPDTRFWRLDVGADYGPLNSLARNRVRPNRIRESWPDMLRVAGSLHTGAVRAYDLMRMLSRDGRPSRLGQAFTEYGRIAKTLHLLRFIDVDDTYRRQNSAQHNIQEGRHQLARKIFHGQRGELRQRYREGQEDQLGALGLVLNAVVLWNTFYMDLAVKQLRTNGYPVHDADVARLSPLGFKHIHFLGRYAFTPSEPGQVRPLRDPSAADDDEDDE